jgi:hypothetical protein
MPKRKPSLSLEGPFVEICELSQPILNSRQEQPSPFLDPLDYLFDEGHHDEEYYRDEYYDDGGYFDTEKTGLDEEVSFEFEINGLIETGPVRVFTGSTPSEGFFITRCPFLSPLATIEEMLYSTPQNNLPC